MSNQQRPHRSVILLPSTSGHFPTLPASESLRLLHRYASQTKAGAVVAVGGLPADVIQAAAGGLAASSRGRAELYRIAPQDGSEQSVATAGLQAVFGAGHGTEDRVAMRTVDLPDAQVAASWTESIGMLLLNLHAHGVSPSSDDRLNRWLTRLQPGGILAVWGEPGPRLSALVRSRVLRQLERQADLTFLQKMQDTPASLEFQPRRQLLVCCERLSRTGGIQRFVSLAEELRTRGHRLVIAHMGPDQPAPWGERVECMPLAEAAQQRWDATMVPGAGFSVEAVKAMEMLRGPQFGLRVQHILNAPERRQAFALVNQTLAPHVVIFNNRHWSAGSYVDLEGDRFYRLEGAVDCERFSPLPFRRPPRPEGTVLLAGQAHKNAEPLIGALRLLPGNYEVELFGGGLPLEQAYKDLVQSGRLRILPHIPQRELAAAYHRWDIVVHTEDHAGWANMVAEAMASGLPVVCTRAGTLPLAEHGQTALCLNDAKPEAVASAVQRLVADPELVLQLTRNAREQVRSWNWRRYADRLLNMLFEDSGSHYVDAPELGMHGKWPVAARLHGLETLWSRVAGKRILDLGCAEGLIARNCYEHGAKVVWGLDREEQRVAKARELCKAFRHATFQVTDLGDWSLLHATHGAGLDLGTDITLHLGLHHHLPQRTRVEVIRELLRRTRELFLLRCPAKVYENDQLAALLSDEGFDLIAHEGPPSFSPTMGDLWYFERIRPWREVEPAESAAPQTPSMELHSSAMRQPHIRYRAPRRPKEQVRRHLVSFPKSGRTWLRYALSLLGVDEVHFEHDGFEFNDGQRPGHNFDAQARRLRLGEARVVYLERDPRDVMVSLYRQVTGRFAEIFHYRGTSSEFIRDPYFGAHNLQRFRAMWDELCAEGLAHKVSYEACHADFPSTLKMTLDHLRVGYSEPAIVAASRCATFEQMHAVELAGHFSEPWLRLRNGHPKVRRGKVGSHQQELTESDIAFLNEVFELPPYEKSPH